jgi:hypothetical protein
MWPAIRWVNDMELMLKEIINAVSECEANKGIREAERIRQERKCYADIKGLVEPFIYKKDKEETICATLTE